MSQIKAYVPEVANMVGIQASLLLQHIKYWIEKYDLEKLYRTNEQISNDFEGTLSESQIQRAKKKLVDNGLVIVSHDMGHKRTTHYKLTEKARNLLGMVKAVVEKVKKVFKKKEKPTPTKTTSMEDSFKKQGDTSHAVAMPEEAKQLLKKISKPKPEVVEEDFEQLSDDEYFSALDIAMVQCQQPEKQLSLNELMGQAFSQVPNIDQFEKNRMELEYARNFKEDY